MRSFAIATCFLFLTTIALAETVVIGAPASQRIEVTVLRKGSPVTGVSISFYLNVREKPYWIGTSDANGKLFPPKLIPGSYRIVAKSGAREGELDLEVIEDSQESKLANIPPAKFDMNLILPRVGDAENAPITAWVRGFEGVVVDPVDAVISDAEVEIYRQEDVESGPIVKLKTDGKGRFSANLNKGKYVALFWSNGFATYRLVFEVTEKGVSTLRIPLKVGSVA